MDDGERSEQIIGLRSQAQQGAAPVGSGSFPDDQPQCFQPVDETSGAVRLEDQTFGDQTDGWLFRTSASDREQSLVLLGREPDLDRLVLAEGLEATDRMAKRCQRFIVGIFQRLVVRTQ